MHNILFPPAAARLAPQAMAVAAPSAAAWQALRYERTPHHTPQTLLHESMANLATATQTDGRQPK